MSARPDRFQSLVAVAIAVTATCAALVAYVQSDAAARDDRASRDSKRYATEAFGRQVAGDARTNYDYYTAYQAWTEFETLSNAAHARGDGSAAQRYETMQQRMVRLTPLLSPPYFDAEKGVADPAAWDADVYIEEIAALRERYDAASSVKEAWDGKANTYIVHLTLLAVALALLGLSATLAGAATRAIFSAMAGLIGGVAVLWALVTWVLPVPDLRASAGAIEAYAKAAALAHRERWPEAQEHYGKALAIAPDYIHALTGRAEAHQRLDKRQEAAADYEKARALGDKRAWVAGNLAWLYYEMGRMQDAVAMNKEALAAGPDELWIQFDLGLAQLAAGQNDDAKASYQAGLDKAAQAVATATAAKHQASSSIWESLEDAGQSLDSLIEAIDGDGSAPPRDKVAQGPALRSQAEQWLATVKSLAVSLEYEGKPPAGEAPKGVGELRFAAVHNGAVDSAEGTEFPLGTANVALRFDYTGLTDGRPFVIKVFFDGEEDPSWRFVADWDLGAEGTGERVLAPPAGSTYTLPAGEYHVEVYVDGHFVRRGSFEVASEAVQAQETPTTDAAAGEAAE